MTSRAQSGNFLPMAGKTPGKPIDPGEAWTLEKLIVLGVITLGSFLVFIYSISPSR